MASLTTDPPDLFQVVGVSGAGRDMEILAFAAHIGWREIYLHMVEIDPTEVGLTTGRFTRFSRFRQSCRVTVADDSPLYQVRMARNERLLNWIHDNTHGRWSFYVEYNHLSDWEMEWNFESSADAVMFKLTWA